MEINNRNSNKGPGRPPNDQADSFIAQYWFWELALRIGTSTGYGVEKYFSPHKFSKNQSVISRSCKYDKHKRGNNTPNSTTIEEAEISFPGTARYIEHPFREIARPTIRDLESLYFNLAKLRPEIANVLFEPTCESQQVTLVRKKGLMDTLKQLGREGDWDALTACLGLIHECRLVNNVEFHYFYARTTLPVFIRFVSQDPFSMTAEEVFEYLKKQFLFNPEKPDWNKFLDSINLRSEMFCQQYMASLIEDLGILKQMRHFFTPSSCLYIAERYLTPPILKTCIKLTLNGERKKIKKLREIRNLTRALRRWEDKLVGSKTTTMI